MSLANDEPSLDALIERHQVIKLNFLILLKFKNLFILLKDHKNEIDTHDITFVEFNKFSADLVNGSHPQSADVLSKTNELNSQRVELVKKWRGREIKLNQCFSFVLFERDCQSAEKWMHVRENALMLQSSDQLDDAFRKYEDLDRAISLHEEKITRLTISAEELIRYEHYASNKIKTRIDEVLERWSKLKQSLLESRVGLDESQTVEKFLFDAREIEEWLDEKNETIGNLKTQATSDFGDILVILAINRVNSL